MAAINRELDSVGSPEKPTGRTPEELTGMLDMVEKTERDIHAKQSEASSCAEDMAAINRELDSVGSPEKPTGRTPEELTGMLDMVEKTERDIHAKTIRGLLVRRRCGRA